MDLIMAGLSLRQGDELVTPSYPVEALFLPIIFGLFELFLETGNKVPPEMTFSVDGRAAKQYHRHNVEPAEIAGAGLDDGFNGVWHRCSSIHRFLVRV
jgi:hypothetical protein